MKEVSAALKKTKTERFVEMVDGLEVGGTGVIVELGDTHHQTFRVLVTRYYTSKGDDRSFMMRNSDEGLLVFRVK